MSKGRKASPRPRRDRSRHGLRHGREAWIRAARAALIGGGLQAVRVERLASTLKATRAAFYYHFASREKLLGALVRHWKDSNTGIFRQSLSREAGSPDVRIANLTRIWIEEREFDPAFDSAMRDWARVSPDVARSVRQVDRQRIELLRMVFLDLGYAGVEAFIRARITYFHQVGYYTLGLRETRTRRRELAPIYTRVLIG